MFHDILFLITVLAAGNHVSVAILENKIDLTFSERITNVLQKKCTHNVGQGYNIKKDLQQFKDDCFNLFTGPEEITDENLTTKLCQEQNQKFLQCLPKLTETVEPCLNPQEKEAKKFLLDIFKTTASTNIFCDHINTLNTNQTLKTNTRKCITTLRKNPEINPHRVCLAKSTLIGDYSKEEIPTKEESCFNVLEINSCYIDLLEQHCPGPMEVSLIQRELITAALNKCAPLLFRGTSVKFEEITTPSSLE